MASVRMRLEPLLGFAIDEINLGTRLRRIFASLATPRGLQVRPRCDTDWHELAPGGSVGVSEPAQYWQARLVNPVAGYFASPGALQPLPVLTLPGAAYPYASWQAAGAYALGHTWLVGDSGIVEDAPFQGSPGLVRVDYSACAASTNYYLPLAQVFPLSALLKATGVVVEYAPRGGALDGMRSVDCNESIPTVGNTFAMVEHLATRTYPIAIGCPSAWGTAHLKARFVIPSQFDALSMLTLAIGARVPNSNGPALLSLLMPGQTVSEFVRVILPQKTFAGSGVAYYCNVLQPFIRGSWRHGYRFNTLTAGNMSFSVYFNGASAYTQYLLTMTGAGSAQQGPLSLPTSSWFAWDTSTTLAGRLDALYLDIQPEV